MTAGGDTTLDGRRAAEAEQHNKPAAPIMIKYAAAAAIAAVLASKYTSQPPPYDDGAASIIRVDARLLAGNAHGAPFPPVYKGNWALNDRLTKATRLYEGQVEGSESVATLKDGTLLTVDKYGWVWTCVEIFASSSTTSTRRDTG